MAEKADLRRILEEGGEFTFPHKGGKVITARYMGGVLTLLEDGKVLSTSERDTGRRAIQGLIQNLEDNPRVLEAANVTPQASAGAKARRREVVQSRLSPDVRAAAQTKVDRVFNPETGVTTEVPSAARAAAGETGDVGEAIRQEERSFAQREESRQRATSGRGNIQRGLEDQSRERFRQTKALEEDLERLTKEFNRRKELFKGTDQEDKKLSRLVDEILEKEQQLDALDKPKDFRVASGGTSAPRVREVEIPSPTSPKGRKDLPVRSGTFNALLREAELQREAELAEGRVKTSGGSPTIEEARLTGDERILDREINQRERELANAEAERDKLIAERKKTPKGQLKSVDSKLRTAQNNVARLDEELRGLRNTAPSDFGQTGVDASGTPEIEGSFEARRQVGGGVARDASEINLRGTEDLPEAEEARIARARADDKTRQMDRLLGVDSPEDIKVVRNKLNSERGRLEERLRSLGRAGTNPAAELEAQSLSRRISEIDKQIGSLETRQMMPSSGMTNPSKIVEAREQGELRRGMQPATVGGKKPVVSVGRGRESGMLSLLSRIGDRVERAKEARARGRLVATAVDDDFGVPKTIPATAPGHRRPAKLLRDDPALLADEQRSKGREMRAIRKKYARAQEGVRQMVIQDAGREKSARQLRGLIDQLKSRRKFVEDVRARKGDPKAVVPKSGPGVPKYAQTEKGIVGKIFTAATAKFGNKEKATRFMQRLTKSGMLSGGKAPLILLSLLGLAGAGMMGGGGRDDRAA